MRKIHVFMILILVGCKKKDTTDSSGSSFQNVSGNSISTIINGNYFSYNSSDTTGLFTQNIQGCSSLSVDSGFNAFGIIYYTNNPYFSRVEIYFSKKNSTASYNPTLLWAGYHTFYDSDVFFDMFDPGEKTFLYNIPDSESCIPFNPHTYGVYVRAVEKANGREWVTFKRVNNVHFCDDRTNIFNVTYKSIVNQNYNDSFSGMNKFPSVFINGNFECELYNCDSVGRVDSMRMKTSSFSGPFIGYLAF